jgi:hypothetical protein
VKNQELVRRIEELEKQVRELQARPVYIPVYNPPILPQPHSPQPWYVPTVWCGPNTAAQPTATYGVTS